MYYACVHEYAVLNNNLYINILFDSRFVLSRILGHTVPGKGLADTGYQYVETPVSRPDTADATPSSDLNDTINSDLSR